MLLCKGVQLRAKNVYWEIEWFSFLGVESSDLNAALNYLESITFSQKQAQKHKTLSTAQAVQNQG